MKKDAKTAHKADSKSAIYAKMREHKIKVTRQREKIIDCLMTAQQPQTAEQIMAKLKKSKDQVKCDLVTIYRSLHQFEKINLVQKSFFSENSAQYCLNDIDDHDHHHHFLCKKCQKITEIDACIIEGQLKALEKKGFRDISHRLEFFGICPQCAA